MIVSNSSIRDTRVGLFLYGICDIEITGLHHVKKTLSPEHEFWAQG